LRPDMIATTYQLYGQIKSFLQPLRAEHMWKARAGVHLKRLQKSTRSSHHCGTLTTIADCRCRAKERAQRSQQASGGRWPQASDDWLLQESTTLLSTSNNMHLITHTRELVQLPCATDSSSSCQTPKHINGFLQQTENSQVFGKCVPSDATNLNCGHTQKNFVQLPRWNTRENWHAHKMTTLASHDDKKKKKKKTGCFSTGTCSSTFSELRPPELLRRRNWRQQQLR